MLGDTLGHHHRRQYRARFNDGRRRGTAPSAGGLVIPTQYLFLEFGPKHEANTLEEAGEDDQAIHPSPADDSVVDRAVLQAQSPVELDAKGGVDVAAIAAAAAADIKERGASAADTGPVERWQS